MSEKEIQDLFDRKMRLQAQEYLAKVFGSLSCKGVADEILMGRNVTGNSEFGVRFCVHDKLGPRVDVETYEFSPQTEEAKDIEERFIYNVNMILTSAKFPRMRPELLRDLRAKDKAFEERMKGRRVLKDYKEVVERAGRETFPLVPGDIKLDKDVNKIRKIMEEREKDKIE